MKKSDISNYIKAVEARKRAEAKEAEAKAALVAALDEAGVAEMIAYGYAISNKPYTSDRVDTKRLKAEKPEVAAAYTTTTMAKRFNVKPATA